MLVWLCVVVVVVVIVVEVDNGSKGSKVFADEICCDDDLKNEIVGIRTMKERIGFKEVRGEVREYEHKDYKKNKVNGDGA